MGNDKLKNLQIWNKARQAASSLGKALAKFVNEKVRPPVDHLRRSAVAMPANVIKGFRRGPGRRQSK